MKENLHKCTYAWQMELREKLLTGCNINWETFYENLIFLFVYLHTKDESVQVESGSKTFLLYVAKQGQ